MMGTRVISFSLYGSDPMYWRGLLKNLELAPYIYPGWRVWVYTTEEWAECLCRTPQASTVWIVVREPSGNHGGLFWRFLPALEDKIDRFIVRDTDSRLNIREAAAVQEWIESGKPFHCMRDNEQHSVPILGGMWGAVRGAVPGMQEALDNWKDFNKGDDQHFLRKHVWPVVKDQCICHDSNPELAKQRFEPHDVRPFPPHPPTDTQYVGEVVRC